MILVSLVDVILPMLSLLFVPSLLPPLLMLLAVLLLLLSLLLPPLVTPLLLSMTPTIAELSVESGGKVCDHNLGSLVFVGVDKRWLSRTA